MEFPLTNGGSTLIDSADYQIVSIYKWCRSNGANGYRHARRTADRKELHAYLMNPPQGMCVDHINGDTLDNRRSNLRVCTHAQNAMNRRPVRNGKKGVTWNKQCEKWQAAIKMCGRSYYLGLFTTEDAAAAAYDAKARELFGAFAWLNSRELT